MIKFISFPYSLFYTKLTRFGSNYKEAEVETTFNNSYIASSAGILDVIKYQNTDGVICYTDNKGREYIFIQETKNGKYHGTGICSLSNQLGQAIYYYFYNWIFKYNNNNIAGFIINTENFIGFIKIKDIINLLKELEPLYRNTNVKSASHIKEDKAIVNKIKDAIKYEHINLNIVKLNSEIDLSDCYAKIFN